MLFNSFVEGVRPEWMHAAASAAQRMAGRLLTDQPARIEVRVLLHSSIPAPASQIEAFILDGLIARAEREAARAVPAGRHLTGSDTVAARAAALLRARYAEPWSLERLARALHSNRCTLTSEFRRTFGISVHQFLVVERVTAAQRRLAASDDKLETIAQDVGFGSRKTLYDAYRRVTGCRLQLNRSRL